MQQLTPQGQQVVSDLAHRHGFSADAVSHMLFAVLHGNGSMAQFSHWEFGGSGQWMKGGMIMLGDMFNHGLKGRVDSLCWEIGNLLNSQPGLLRYGSFQSQSQDGSGSQQQAAGTSMGASSLFLPDPEQNWWPQDLGSPSATGAQNQMRYAYFPHNRRLAVKTGSEVWVYDTLDHQIGGFSQQQGGGSSILFSSQYGTVNLSTLPALFRNGQPLATNQTPAPPPFVSSATSQAPSDAGRGDVVSAIERLGELLSKGILTQEEFAAKKAELLARL